jgi:hypothetical protein
MLSRSIMARFGIQPPFLAEHPVLKHEVPMVESWLLCKYGKYIFDLRSSLTNSRIANYGCATVDKMSLPNVQFSMLKVTMEYEIFLFVFINKLINFIYNCKQNIFSVKIKCILKVMGRSQWPRGLRRRSAAAWLLGSQVRITLGAWMFASCVYMLCCPV